MYSIVHHFAKGRSTQEKEQFLVRLLRQNCAKERNLFPRRTMALQSLELGRRNKTMLSIVPENYRKLTMHDYALVHVNSAEE